MDSNSYQRAFGDILNGQADTRSELNPPPNFFSNSPTKEIFPSNLPPRSNPTARISLASSLIHTTTAKQLCSQCREGRSSEFPIRIASLEPYVICRAHTWYWTEAVKAKNWAPEVLSVIGDVVGDILDNIAGIGTTTTWVVDGREGDRAALLECIETAGNWESTLLKTRASRATSHPPPPPVVTYYLTPPEVIAPEPIQPAYKLSFTFHSTVCKFVIAFKPEVAVPRKQDAAWKKSNAKVNAKAKKEGGATDEPKAKKPRLSKQQKEQAALTAQAPNLPALLQPLIDHYAIDPNEPSTSSSPNRFTDPSPLAQLAQVAATLEFVQNLIPRNDIILPAPLPAVPNHYRPESEEEEVNSSSSPSSARKSDSDSIPLKITPRKRSYGNTFVYDLSPDSQVDELESTTGDREEERDLSVSLDEMEEDSSEEEGDWLFGLVRSELM